MSLWFALEKPAISRFHQGTSFSGSVPMYFWVEMLWTATRPIPFLAEKRSTSVNVTLTMYVFSEISSNYVVGV